MLLGVEHAPAGVEGPGHDCTDLTFNGSIAVKNMDAGDFVVAVIMEIPHPQQHVGLVFFAVFIICCFGVSADSAAARSFSLAALLALS